MNFNYEVFTTPKLAKENRNGEQNGLKLH